MGTCGNGGNGGTVGLLVASSLFFLPINAQGGWIASTEAHVAALLSRMQALYDDVGERRVRDI